jgi:hypothetical protein
VLVSVELVAPVVLVDALVAPMVLELVELGDVVLAVSVVVVSAEGARVASVDVLVSIEVELLGDDVLAVELPGDVLVLEVS